MTAVADPPITRPGRVIGVDVARGVALFGMMAVHIYDALDDDAPTTAWVVAGGRSAATFVLIAGVSLAFMSGGRRVVHGSDRLAASAGLAVRALLIGAIGLVLGFWDTAGVDVILPYYGLMFLLAIPILTLPPRVLAVISAAFLVLGPVLLVLTARVGSVTPRHLTAVTLMTDPAGLLTQLVLTGFYPAVAYMTYLCAGIALGRLDLRSPRLAWWLFGGGIALAVTARLVSWVLLGPVGGLAHLLARTHSPDSPAELLWDPQQGTSWWYLAVPAPHANTPVDLAHPLGSAMAVLGAALLLSRVAAVRRYLEPVAAVGSMTLTLYSAHVLGLATGVAEDWPLATYLVMVIAALVFAVIWRRCRDQGPLEELVARAANRARRSTLRASAARTSAGGRHRAPDPHSLVLSRSATPVGAPERE